MSDGRHGGCGQRGDIRQSSTARMVFFEVRKEQKLFSLDNQESAEHAILQINS